MTCVLVSGANGFIGSELCRQLKRDGYFVRVAVRNVAADSSVECDEVIEIGDIGLVSSWSYALKGIDVVVHLAARAHILKENSSDPLYEFRRINVEGTKLLTYSCAVADVKRIVFLSSIGVNGECTKDSPFTEDDVHSPKTSYAISKWEAEQALVEIARMSHLEYTIIRSPLVYGPKVPGNLLRLLKAIAIGIPLPLLRVDNMRSFIGVSNLADLIKTCISHPKAANQLFLASDGEDISTPELICKISSLMGKPARLFPFPMAIVLLAARLIGRYSAAKRLLSSLQVDSSKACDLLDWKPIMSVDEGLEDAVRWYCENVRR